MCIQVLRKYLLMLKAILQQRIELAVENLSNTGGWRFGTEVSELSKLVSRINNPHLGLCLDTGHLFVGRESVSLSKDVFACGKD